MSVVPDNAELTWQEYQELVSEFYERLGGAGVVHRNITRPDRLTGQPRQIDTWLEMEARTHSIGILIDAKRRKSKIDVKDIAEVLELAESVGACKAVIVCSGGWTPQADQKAKFAAMDLRLFTIREALELKYEHAWVVCPGCERDAIFCDPGFDLPGGWGAPFELFVTGGCNTCAHAWVWCWTCGVSADLEQGEEFICYCPLRWVAADKDVYRVIPPAGSICKSEYGDTREREGWATPEPEDLALPFPILVVKPGE